MRSARPVSRAALSPSPRVSEGISSPPIFASIYAGLYSDLSEIAYSARAVRTHSSFSRASLRTVAGSSRTSATLLVASTASSKNSRVISSIFSSFTSSAAIALNSLSRA